LLVTGQYPDLPPPLQLTEVAAALVTRTSQRTTCKDALLVRDVGTRYGVYELSKFAAEWIIRSRQVGSEPLPLALH